MSIKRSKEVSRRREPDREDNYWGKKPERVWEWKKDVVQHAPDAFVVYGPAHAYNVDDHVVHKAFGPGVVTSVDGAKVEILFRVGAKKLAHDPKGTRAEAAPPPSFAEPEPPPAPARADDAAPAADVASADDAEPAPAAAEAASEPEPEPASAPTASTAEAAPPEPAATRDEHAADAPAGDTPAAGDEPPTP